MCVDCANDRAAISEIIAAVAVAADLVFGIAILRLGVVLESAAVIVVGIY